jgi:hypothetical protein
LGVGIVSAILLLALHLSGLCFSEFRYLADAEAIERALIYRASSIKGLDKPGGASREDVRAYLREHPDCCRVEQECPMINASSRWLDKFLECGATWVRIRHPLDDASIAASRSTEKNAEALVEIDNCGERGRTFAGRLP